MLIKILVPEGTKRSPSLSSATASRLMTGTGVYFRRDSYHQGWIRCQMDGHTLLFMCQSIKHFSMPILLLPPIYKKHILPIWNATNL